MVKVKTFGLCYLLLLISAMAAARSSKTVGDGCGYRLVGIKAERLPDLNIPYEYLIEPLAQVLVSLGVTRGMVVYGMDKLDEISMSSETRICEINDGWFRTTTITPEDFGFTTCKKEDLVGGTPEENAQITKDILSGKTQGPKRGAVLLNAGASLYIGGKAASMAEGVKLAAEIIDSGKATVTLNKLIEVSNRPEA